MVGLRIIPAREGDRERRSQAEVSSGMSEQMGQNDVMAEVLRQKNAARERLGLPPTSVKGTYLRPKTTAGAISKAKREKLFKRDKHTCQICGRRFPEQNLVPNHIDHNRKHNALDNLQTTCTGCNMNEGRIYARLLREAGPRSEVPEVRRLQIAEAAGRIAREQARRKK